MPSEPPARSPELLSASESLLLVVDVQERLLPQIAGREQVVRGCRLLSAGAELFSVPTVVTEQYPKGLGPTVPDLAGSLPAAAVKAEKLRFSAAEATGWPTAGEREDGRHQVVIAGIETHICVLQTAIDLAAWGYRVFVCADATGSRLETDHAIALARLRDGGVTVTTTESVLFEWCEAAGTDRFRSLRDLVTGR